MQHELTLAKREKSKKFFFCTWILLAFPLPQSGWTDSKSYAMLHGVWNEISKEGWSLSLKFQFHGPQRGKLHTWSLSKTVVLNRWVATLVGRHWSDVLYIRYLHHDSTAAKLQLGSGNQNNLGGGGIVTPVWRAAVWRVAGIRQVENHWSRQIRTTFALQRLEPNWIYNIILVVFPRTDCTHMQSESNFIIQ